MERSHTRQQLREFGLLVGGIFGLIGLWPMVWRHQSPRTWAVTLAVLLVGAALVAPRILASIYRLWMKLAEVLAWINTRILHGVVFSLMVVTPIGLVMRMLGHDPRRVTWDSRLLMVTLKLLLFLAVVSILWGSIMWFLSF